MRETPALREEPMEIGAAYGRFMPQEAMSGISSWACTIATENPVGKYPEPDLGESLVWAHINTKACPGIPAHALVNSRATTNFMDVAFAAKYVIPQCQVDPPMLVETIDGWVLLSGLIKTATQLLRLIIGCHEEAIQFYITSSLHFPLGLAWLRMHDPQIYWSQNLTSFPSLQCMDHTHQLCASQLLSPTGVSLPSKLVDFMDIFSQQEADQLPPHQPYHCWMHHSLWAVCTQCWTLTWPHCRIFWTRILLGVLSSPRRCPCLPLFVKKKTSDLRLCCDYRKLNTITATIFTKLDLCGAYNLDWIQPRDE
ncbi:Retrotransposon-derived protein PEG10, partial [Ophiophagus hannah]